VEHKFHIHFVEKSITGHLVFNLVRFIRYGNVKMRPSLFAVAVHLTGITIPLQAKWLTIHNDFDQYGTDGNPILTRSGDPDKFGNPYYWYGGDISSGLADQTCFSSTDLPHRKNEGVRSLMVTGNWWPYSSTILKIPVAVKPPCLQPWDTVSISYG
jgi:hypothetical protein